MDNGFAIGVYYQYTSGTNDFNLNFFNNGFTTSNGNPEQIVLTASTADQLSFQIGIFIYNSSYVYLDDEVWQINGNPNIIYHKIYKVDGIYDTLNVIKLAIFTSSGHNYVGYYLDGTQYDTYQIQFLTFDNEMSPSAVIESADTIANDWTGNYIQGFLRTGLTNLHTWFYGGIWGALNAGFSATQTSAVYVGQNVEAPTNVGTSGYNMGYGTGACMNCLGNVNSVFFITDPTIANEASIFAANSGLVRIG
jgi:hypothetical protein